MKKVVYYNDLLNDDFAGTKIKRKELPKDFRFHHTNPFYRFLSNALYYMLALPVIFLYLKVFCRVKVVGKKNIRSLRRKSYFVYGNHTQIIDALTAQIFASKGKRTYIVADQDATSISGIRGLLSMLGVIPVPSTPEQSKRFKEAVAYHMKRKHVISIFPEAHIWPYYTHIRPFTDASFIYPCEQNRPVVCMVMTYRRRKFLKKRKPLPTLHLSKPFYPDERLSIPDRKKALRNQVYEYFLDITCEDDNVEYIVYKKAPNEAE